ncbi:MAG: UDP-N-acetylmuramoyl-L-alanyl-D-glutamate--2,6-diaminopimelate ligase [bacterium]|nr:UDP-N-acetylmuramoyl-L-alanyl-D-glutamate--2,6-diaminopimelate ligase [bacterium]
MFHALKQAIPQSLKNIFHLCEAILGNILYGFPAKKLTVIGVTGTNGKTTTTQFIARILEQSGKRVAVASTINFKVAGEEIVNRSKLTTLSRLKLQKFLRQAVDAGCTHAVLEASSHALDQNRVWGIPCDIAVMTNVTREHLDYHQTMAEYRRAKRRLFLKAKRAVISLDMVEPEYFHPDTKKPVIFYSIKNPQAHLLAQSIGLDFKGTEFTADGVQFHLHIPGLFNIENALAALGVAQLLGIDFIVAKEALGSVTSVPGRMELVPNIMNADIIIDYAVTPDAFEKVYASILPLKIPGTKIIHVFGACGERDRGKRPLMGEIASSYADIIILTNEDPFHEDAEQIIDDIEKGVTKKKDKNYFRIFDRREAIHKALSLAEIGDIVLITGKGAETSMAIGNKRLPWSERGVVEEELTKLTSVVPG